jgi:Fe-S cluster assembly protein SufD
MTLEHENTMTGQETIDAATASFGIFNREEVERLSRRRNEPAWMLAKRLRAWTVYCEMPRESTASPVSKRLDVSQMKFEELQGPIWSDAPVVQNDTPASLLPQGVISSTLSEALRDHPDLIEKYFMTGCVRINENAFTALHAAFWNVGSFLYVPKNVKIDLPIENIIVKEKGNDVLFPHTLIIVEEGAMATFIETSRSTAEHAQAFVDGVVEIFAGSGATVNYVSPQFFGENVYHFAFKKAIGKKDSTVNWYEIGIGGRVSQSDIQLILNEEGATGELFGIYFPRGHQQMEYRTLQVHAAPHTKSDLLYKGALQEKAKTIFYGVIQVHKGAQRTDAYQANKNILLSSGAHADSIPVLEIEANDVRCTHGATVGPIDEEALYYLMSRGLSRSEATRMLVVGFLVPVIDKIPVTEMREEIQGYVESRIR